MRIDMERKVLLAIELMQRPSGASIAELMRHLECSRKTVYQVLGEMEERNIPLYDSKDIRGNTSSKRWSIREDWLSPRPLILEPNEQVILNLALRRFRFFESASTRKALREIADRISESFSGNRKRDFITTYSSLKRAKSYEHKRDVVDALFTCVDKKKRARITYTAAQTGATKTYEIDPYTIVDHDNALYAIAGIPSHDGDIRVLAVERISAIETAGLPRFTVPEGYDPETYLSDSFGIIVEESVQVRALFAPGSALYATERVWGKNQESVQNEDGSVLVSFSASGLVELTRWALSWGGNVKILEPPELVEAVAKEVHRASALYPLLF